MYGCMNSMSTIYNPTNRRKKKNYSLSTLCHAPSTLRFATLLWCDQASTIHLARRVPDSTGLASKYSYGNMGYIMIYIYG